MSLPYHHNLPINLLSAVFNNTTATYKFYWLIALVEVVESGKLEIPKNELFAKMISNSWYTINYFHLSFGKFDLLQKAVTELAIIENITIDEHRDIIQQKLISSINRETMSILKHFNNNVPHWFLSPWFPSKSKSEINKYSQLFENKTLYALYNDKVLINNEWKEYLQQNAKIIKDFCYWNLALFLQARNPNVPDIPNKLIKPAIRSSLQKQTKNFWEPVFSELGQIECIFTGEKLTYSQRNFAIDHFVPYAFVSHDLIWNLVPIEKNFNSSKSDKLPPFEVYFEKFKSLQKKAFEIHLHINNSNKFLEEYLTIFPSISHFDETIFQSTIQPLITIASNNGFLYLNAK